MARRLVLLVLLAGIALPLLLSAAPTHAQGGPLTTFTLTKQAFPPTVADGQRVTFVIRYKNNDRRAALNTVLTDTLPAGLTFVSATGGGFYNAGTRTVTWNRGTVSSGNSGRGSVSFTAVASGVSGCVISNVANITSTTAVPTSSNPVEVCVTPGGVLGVEVTLTPDPVHPLDLLTATYKVTNLGRGSLGGVELQAPTPPSTTFVSATPTQDSGPTPLVWSVGTLDPGDSATFQAVWQVGAGATPGSTITATATATTTTSGVDSANGSAQVTVEGFPALTLTMTASPDPVQSGGGLLYTITFSNQGPDPAAGTTLVVTLPGEVTPLLTSAGGSIGTGTVTWTLGTLAPGATGSVVISGQVDGGLPDGTPLTAEGALQSTTLCAGAAPCSAQAEVTVSVESRPVLEITKSGPATATAGGSVSYLIEYRNVGNATATGVDLVDPIPEHTSFVLATAGGFLDGNHARWSLGDIPPNSGGSVNLILAVDSPLTDGTVVVNAATLTAPDAEPVTDTATTLISSKPLLQLTKSVAPDPVRPGQQLLYTLEYRNVGTDTATGVTLTDAVPTGTTFVSASGGGSESGGTVTWNLPDLGPGFGSSVSFLVTVPAAAANDTLITNGAVLTSNETPPTQSTATARVSASPAFSLLKTAQPGDVVAAGEQVLYTLEITNIGDATATGVVLEDLVPAGASILVASPGGTVSGQTVTWAIGDLAPAQTTSVQLTVEVPTDTPDGSLFVNTATVSATGVPPLTQSTPVLVTNEVLLELIKTATPSSVAPGDGLIYTIQYTNIGAVPAIGVYIDDYLPDGVTYVSSTGGILTGTDVVSFNDLGPLAPGEGGTVSVIVTVDSDVTDGTILENVVFAEAAGSRPFSGSTTTPVTAGTPRLEVEKAASPSIVAPGGQVLYTIGYRNLGNADASGVLILDQLPAGVTPVVLPPNATYSATNGTVTFTIGDLPAGTGAAVEFTVAMPPAPDGAVLTNIATLTAPGAQPATVDTPVTIRAQPALTISKTASPSPVAAGGTITWEIDVTNVGTGTASGITVVDALPPETSFLDATPTPTTQNGNLLSWSLSDLGPGAGQTIVIDGLVGGPLPNGTTLANSVTATATGIPPVSTLTLTPVSSAPQLSLTKTATPDPVSAGGAVLFRIDYQNTGNDTAFGVLIQDALPARTTFAGASPGGVYDPLANTVTWGVGSVPPLSGGFVEVVVVVDSPLPNGTNIDNVATIAANGVPPRLATTRVPVGSAPALTLIKTADQTVYERGALLTYTLEFSNVGNEDATGVTLVDPLPPQVDFVAATGSATYDDATRTVTWDLGTVPAASGTFSVELTVRVRSDAAGDIVNTATIGSPLNPPLPATSAVPSAVPIPISGPWGLLLLIATLAGVGVWWLGRA